MYIPDFWCGFGAGFIVCIVLMVAITLVISNDKGEEEK